MNKVMMAILEDLPLTSAEQGYLQTSYTPSTTDITLSRAVGTIYAVKQQQMQVDRSMAANREVATFLVEHIETAVDRMIESEKNLAASNDKWARAMSSLTLAIAIFTAVQAGAAVLGIFLKH